MDRRTFLKATLVSAGSLVVGCSDDEGETGATADAGSDAGTDLGIGDAPGGRPLEPGEAFFPQSVASGDPRPSSVVLWTRVDDPARSDADLTLELEVAIDASFDTLVSLEGGTSVAALAEAQYDHCAKIKVEGLDPSTHYFYRFIYSSGGTDYVSHTGRTKTAPAASDDAAVRFAWVSCQAYGGLYFNAYAPLAREELDFVVHLGDYIYESRGDPLVEEQNADRAISFRDEEGAITFSDGSSAARSLSNYRDIYRIIRSDRHLQSVHERFPMIVVWDDHELADDSWGSHSNDTSGREDENDLERAKNARQAWFEYMPVDYPDDPDFRYDPGADHPDDITIYRDFEFGQHLHLFMMDERSYRPDHIVAEDALPGAVAISQAELEAMLDELPPWAVPYVDIATYADGIYQTALIEAATGEGYDPAKITGLISVGYINAVVDRLNADLEPDEQIALITEEDEAGLEVGISFEQMLKFEPYSRFGARIFGVIDPWMLYADYRYAQTGGASEDVLGAAQQSWLLDGLNTSTKTWKALGNPFPFMPNDVDLRTVESLPERFRQRIRIILEDWAGMPNRSDSILAALAAVENAVVLTGDRHAFMAGTPFVRGDRESRVPELVGSSISSVTFGTQLIRAAASNATLAAAGAVGLAALAHDFLHDPLNRPNPHLAYSDLDRNGFAIAEVDAQSFSVSFHAIHNRHAATSLSDDEIDDKFSVERFKIDAGSPDLYRDFEGTWRRWDTGVVAYVED